MADEATAIWDRLREHDKRHNDLALQVAGHLASCDVRHQEIVRRQGESATDRSNLRAEMASGFTAIASKIEAQNEKSIQGERNNFRMWLGVAGAVLVGVVNVLIGVLPYLIGKG